MVDQSTDETSGEKRQAAAPQSLKDLVERLFLLGVGAAALSKDRLQEIVEELVRRGHLSRDEGRDMVDKLVARTAMRPRAP
jgi:polyhydroxyalkanoate synthesis regulator phasin